MRFGVPFPRWHLMVRHLLHRVVEFDLLTYHKMLKAKGELTLRMKDALNTRSPPTCSVFGGLTAYSESITWLVLVNRQSRVLLIVRRIYVPPAVVVTVFAFWFRTWLDIGKHVYSCKQHGREVTKIWHMAMLPP